ncbi:Fic family protein [Mesorhizobium sp. M8A.F.Ca.ET.165.01.1.1]|uniref:Fic family protein n=1 Tax=Mesorhizobium sp. M8A.F.Ca.ET.165.01.1.1 TaxID=2563960 RepID=UPI0010940335|nr:Fic family protein [Mesorhizobium sp. M8A.F.Ca.ET.165.01.1.1]TGT46396.1 Fic family protein [Mesorhizobium sp. M8A.F.Ca.ET.165.01.1.1]
MTAAAKISGKKRQLDALKRRVRPGALEGLEHSQRIDITYTSNAIEGNTLTAGETALVLEKGITISGKPLKDHLEAIDHARALSWVLEIASKDDHPIMEADIRNLHHLVVANSKPEIAGQYADSARYVNTNVGVFNFPAPVEIPALMEVLCRWLSAAPSTPRTAFEAHRRFVAIHPFNDGNGRTARLLMNLVLARGGYPPVAIRPEDRPDYIAALEIDQSGGGHIAFDKLLFERLDQTLDIYLDAARQAQDRSAEAGKVIPIRS